jgi:thioredoxin 1
LMVVALLIVVAAGGAVAAGDDATPPPAVTNAPAKAKLPRLVDLGADKCIPCKKMAPILSELKTNYVGQLEVEFIDVWKKPDAAEPYKIRLIPTQIFYDASGKELFRHEGFYGKADILAKWKDLGVNLKSPK